MSSGKYVFCVSGRTAGLSSLFKWNMEIKSGHTLNNDVGT